MKEIRIVIMAFVALMVFQSCEKTIPDPIEVIDIEQEFEVFPTQEIGADGSSFYLNIRGMEQDSCLNSILDAEMSMEGNLITVRINGIIKPEFCEEGLQWLEKKFTLPSMPGNYEIEFLKDEFTSTSGQLIITEQSINLDIENLGGVYVTENSLNILKDNHIWGYFFVDDAAAGTSSYNMEEILSEYIAIASTTYTYNTLEAGNYTFFEVGSNGEIEIYDSKESLTQFAYEADEERYLDEVERILLQLTEFRPLLQYRIESGSGEVFEK